MLSLPEQVMNPNLAARSAAEVNPQRERRTGRGSGASDGKSEKKADAERIQNMANAIMR